MNHYDKGNVELRQSCPPTYRTEAAPLTSKGRFTKEEASAIALLLCIDFRQKKFDLTQFWMGVNVELEHGKIHAETNVTGDNPLLTGKIALAHLNEFPDYYTRLQSLETEAAAYWKKQR